MSLPKCRQMDELRWVGLPVAFRLGSGNPTEIGACHYLSPLLTLSVARDVRGFYDACLALTRRTVPGQLGTTV